ncbi:MAG: uroporphyrinogen-III C-methyltransferase [Alphaproteobacteria bacterium]|nr:uroporphyrinogen-III C-methyltransferase [Alphaproteobacteria bacterium]
MRHFPGFFAVSGRPVLVVGATPAAAAKARLATAAGAVVRHVAGPDEDQALPPPVLAFIATGAGAVDAAHAATLRARGVPVNVVDAPELSDFLVPAIVARGDVVIGISTGGAAPVLARALRERIEQVLPARLGALADLARRWRQRVGERIRDTLARRRFWERALAGPVASLVAAGEDAAAELAFAAALEGSATGAPATGAVQIVGAGPGDPDLLTLKALHALQTADVVLHDELVGAEILALARRDALLVPVGRRRGWQVMTPENCHALMVGHARTGRQVVRLKGGDPNVFGRAGEEVAALREAGIAVTVVPGITAALGCAAAIGMPLTQRGIASNVTFVTGQMAAGSDAPDWRALAGRGQTLAIYMGLATAAELQGRLLAAGLDRATPVAIVARGTLPDQRVSYGSLATLPALAALHRSGEPALLFVGEVVRLAAGHAAVADLAQAS